jgi:hypothetical protein
VSFSETLDFPLVNELTVFPILIFNDIKKSYDIISKTLRKNEHGIISLHQRKKKKEKERRKKKHIVIFSSLAFDLFRMPLSSLDRNVISIVSRLDLMLRYFANRVLQGSRARYNELEGCYPLARST